MGEAKGRRRGGEGEAKGRRRGSEGEAKEDGGRVQYHPGKGAYFSNHFTRTRPCLGAPGITRAIQYPSVDEVGSTRTAMNSPGVKSARSQID